MINDNELDALLASYKPEHNTSANLLPELEKSMNTVDAVMEQRKREGHHDRCLTAISFAAGIAVGLVTACVTQFIPTPSKFPLSAFGHLLGSLARCLPEQGLSTARYVLIAASIILTYFAVLYCTKGKEYAGRK